MSEEGIEGLLTLFAFLMGAALVAIILSVVLRNAPFIRQEIVVGLLLVLIAGVIFFGLIVPFSRARKQQEDEYSEAEPLHVPLRQTRAQELQEFHVGMQPFTR